MNEAKLKIIQIIECKSEKEKRKEKEKLSNNEKMPLNL